MRHSLQRSVPTAHEEMARPVGWIELFYDLVMVAAVIVFSTKVSKDLTVDTTVWFILVFAMLWWMWLSTTLVLNVRRVEDAVVDVIVAVEMFAITLMTIIVADYDRTRRIFVSPTYALIVACVAALNEWLRRRGPASTRRYAARRRNIYLVSAVFWVIGGIAPSPWHGIAWLAAGVIMVLPLTARGLNGGVQVPNLDTEHLSERFALLTMLVIGESFVKVALTASSTPVHEINLIVLPLEVVVIFALWLAYFLDVAPDGMPGGLVARRAWILSHLVLAIGLVGLAIGLGRFITLQDLSQLTDLDAYLLAVPVAIIFLSIATMVATVRGRPGAPIVVTYLAGSVVALGAALVISDVRFLTVNQTTLLLCIITAATAVIARLLFRRLGPPTPSRAAQPDLGSATP